MSHPYEPACTMGEFTWSDAFAEQGADFRKGHGSAAELPFSISRPHARQN